jgi:hypothetical protein
MSEYLNSLSELEPLYEAQPNMRFASTFLSNDYRKYAIKGEAIQDKATGEVFIKDKYGRVLNNTQTNTSIDSEMLRLAMQLRSNPEFIRPSQSGNDSMYINSQIDVMSLFDDNKFDMSTTDWVYKKDGKINADSKYLAFTISANSNGFFIELKTPNVYKANVYDYVDLYNYTLAQLKSSDEDVRNSIMNDLKNGVHNKVDITLSEYNIPKWKNSHAVLNYTLYSQESTDDMTGKSYSVPDTTPEFTFTDFIKVNEMNCVMLPEQAVRKMKQTYVRKNGKRQTFFIVINYILFPKFNNIKKYFIDNKDPDVSDDKAIEKFKEITISTTYIQSSARPVNIEYGVQPLELEYVSIGRFVDRYVDGEASSITPFSGIIYTPNFVSKITSQTNLASDDNTFINRDEQILTTFTEKDFNNFVDSINNVTHPNRSVIFSKEEPPADVYKPGVVWAEPVSTYLHIGKRNLTTELDTTNKEYAVLEMLLSGYKDVENATITMDSETHSFYIGDKKFVINPTP